MVASLLERMDRNLVDSELATFSGPGPVATRVSAAGLTVRSLGKDASLPVATARLARVVRSGAFDVVNAYGFKASLIARAVKAVASPGSRFVCGVRGLHVSELEDVDSAKARAIMSLEVLGSPLVDVYDANSHGALELLADKGVPRRKLRYIANGLDLAAWPSRPRANSAPPVALCVARFVPRKRQVDLVEAAERLVDARGRVPARAGWGRSDARGDAGARGFRARRGPDRVHGGARPRRCAGATRYGSSLLPVLAVGGHGGQRDGGDGLRPSRRRNESERDRGSRRRRADWPARSSAATRRARRRAGGAAE